MLSFLVCCVNLALSSGVLEYVFVENHSTYLETSLEFASLLQLYLPESDVANETSALN